MKRIFATIITLGMVATAAVTSCKKDNTICYFNTTMGNIEGECIVSDQGNTFTIVETPYEVKLEDYKYGRVWIMCDVLTQTGEKAYDIRLSLIESVLTKPAVKASTITDEELLVEDAVVIRDMWCAGGYLNMLIEFAHKEGSETAHWINLIHDDTFTGEGYSFILRHNAYGEVPTQDATFRSSMGYVSFPISQIIKEDEAKITLTWTSHKQTGLGYDLYEKEVVKRDGPWTRSEFEHKNVTVQPSKSFLAK